MNMTNSAAPRWRIGLSMALIAIVAFAGGALAWHFFTSRMLAYGLTARFIGDATVDLAILDALGANGSSQARSIVVTRLRADIEALELQSEYMSDEQQAAANRLKDRAASYMGVRN